MRFPKTIKETRHSIYTRYRVRFALSSYRQRYGLSYQKIIDELRSVLGEEKASLFSDRQLIKEFLTGSEPSDEKLDVLIEYLHSVDPENVIGLFEDEYMQSIGDAFTSYFMPYGSGSSLDYERAMRTQRGKKFEGVYAEFAHYPFDPNLIGVSYNDQVNYTPRFLYLRYIENSPFLLAYTIYFNFFDPNWWVLSKFMSDIYIKKREYCGLYLEPALKLYFESLTGIPSEIATNPIYKEIIPHLTTTEPDFRHSYTVESRGLAFVDDAVAFMVLRDVERRHPVFSKFVWDTPNGLDAERYSMGGLSKVPSENELIHSKRKPLRTETQFFHRISSEQLANCFNDIAWVI